MKKAMKDFYAYSVGICNASVYMCLSDEEAIKRLNEEQPTGISSQWVLSDSPTFGKGEPHPSPCEHAPETHRHLLFHC
jgi:hypothetical protein